MGVANNLLDAIDILAENKVAAVKFDKTVRATIDEVVDASIGKYKVKYQNSIFFAYALDLKTYGKGVQVYVVIPSSDFNKDPYITGTVKKSAATATDVITQADRMTIVGTNVFDMTSHVGFCSYKTNDPKTRTKDLMDLVTIDTQGLALYKKDSDYIQIGATFQTKLDNKQRVGAGNYGIRIRCSYYNSKYTEEERVTEPLIPRIYELNVNNMVGNPYSFGVPSEQSVLFEIDSANLCSIDGIEAFCENFPYSNAGSSEICTGYLNPNNYILYSDPGFTKEVNLQKDLFVYDKITEEWYAWNPDRPQPDRLNNGGYDINKTDIILSNLFFEFYDALTEDELNGLSLRITTPYGNYFYTNSSTGETEPNNPPLILHGDLRVKGKSVNYKEQEVHFYWFIKDNSITTTSSGYSKYGGTGWRCLNTPYYSGTAAGAGTSYSPDTYDKEIGFDLCNAKETQFKCVAVFKDGTDTVSADNTTIIYNKTDTTSPEITLQSTMGADFNFNEGQTDIVCYIDGKTQGDVGDDDDFDPSQYNFYWTYSVDAGNPQPIAATEGKPMRLTNVDVADSYKFVTYECTVKQKVPDGEVDFGSAAITLTNGEPNGQYTLVIKNGTQVFQYTKEGVSPTSPTLDEFDRMTLPMLEFDIYNDKGQLLSFGSNEEKVKRMNIRWIWPGSKDPNNLAENETMLQPSEGTVFKTYDFPDPTSNSSHRKYVVTKQATLTYGLLDSYDLTKYDNNIILEIDYNNQHLSASTNFTFTKDGEAGTNGTKYLTRIVPKESKYSKIVLFKNNNNEYQLYGFNSNAKNFEGINSWAVFKAQVWDGHGNSAYLDSDTSGSSKVSCVWSTLAQDRGINKAVKITNNGVISVSGNIGIGTTIIKVAIKDIVANKTYYATYPLEYCTNLDYYIDGGYRNCSYESDGTRSSYSQQPFTIRQTETGNAVQGTWTTHGWSGKITDAHDDPKYKLIDPPQTYDGESINNYITCIYNNITYYIPIELYLDRYGLSAVESWDGNSIKLNTNGKNYILSPQIGAGKNDSNGFTGITMGTAMEAEGPDQGESIGLFGYHNGQRSIFLDATKGNAIFGKSGASQIIIDATSNEGTIASGDYAAGKGMKIKFSNTGPETDQGPYIKFGSGNFKVTPEGHLTAKGDGRIAGWKISDDTLSSNNGAVYLDSSATTANKKIMFKAGSDFTVAADGTITASKGKIANWTIGENVLSGGTIFLDKAGVIGGGSGGSYKFTDSDNKTHNALRWYIDNSGIGYFSDVRINNNSTSGDSDPEKIKTIISITNKSGHGSNSKEFWVKNDGSMKATSVNITGTVDAQVGKIGDWTISDGTITNKNGFTLDANGTVNLGKGFKATSSSMTGSGALTSGGGSSHGSGYLTGGGSGGPGYSDTSWKDHTVVSGITADFAIPRSSGTITVDGQPIDVNVTGDLAFCHKIRYYTWDEKILMYKSSNYNTHTLNG